MKREILVGLFLLAALLTTMTIYTQSKKDFKKKSIEREYIDWCADTIQVLQPSFYDFSEESLTTKVKFDTITTLRSNPTFKGFVEWRENVYGY